MLQQIEKSTAERGNNISSTEEEWSALASSHPGLPRAGESLKMENFIVAVLPSTPVHPSQSSSWKC